MIIKREKGFVGIIIVEFVVYSSVVPILIFAFGMPTWSALLVGIPILLVPVIEIIAYGRTFILDDEGCMVVFGKYRKKYTWDELKTKRIEKHATPNLIPTRNSLPYRDEAILSPHIIRKPKWIRGEHYSLFHPFSCIYIHFSLHNDKLKRGRYYEVEESEFRGKMKQWGVELEEGG